MESIIILFLTLIGMFILSALPLHISVVVLGGKTTLIKSFLVTIISGILFSILASLVSYGAIIALLLLIWIYHEVFRLKWGKALLAWILQFVFMFLLFLLLSALGLSHLFLDTTQLYSF